ncbi:HNH endonuclease signature motif containing protein [Sandarakinorhabdus sp.]|uniref:HNH endonuclease n=1 Tax=Sandarakinorhabdus sp. TaxID=1916663 RepID=UPI00286E441C|nr:HNH endonuclease signature motif containing protein [Sandarakinorhabdus sp.]
MDLPAIVAVVGSAGATPAQTLSRVLQDLRDDGVLIFDGGGRYRLASGLAGLDIEAAVETETLRMQKARLGQGAFRKALEHRWHGRCPMTGIEERALLRASHIVPWNRCENEAERLSADNGLLLSALWDAAFDRGLVGFDDDGAVMFAASLHRIAEAALRHDANLVLPGLTEPVRQRLQRHRVLHGAGGLRRSF